MEKVIVIIAGQKVIDYIKTGLFHSDRKADMIFD